VNVDELSEDLRREILEHIHATSGERARRIGEFAWRNPAMADLLIDLEAHDDLRAQFEIELLRSLEGLAP
jgi:hypothetical protein